MFAKQMQPNHLIADLDEIFYDFPTITEYTLAHPGYVGHLHFVWQLSRVWYKSQDFCIQQILLYVPDLR